VLAVVLVSACTQPTSPIIASNGLKITNFAVEPSEIYSGSTVRLTLDVENEGGTIVKNISSIVKLDGASLNLFDTTGFYWYNPTESYTKFFDKDLRPSNPLTNTPADSKTLSWVLIAPNVSYGQTRTYVFTSQIYYDYETTGSGTMWVYSSKEADAIRATGGSLNKANFTSAKSPVSVDMRVSPADPVVLFGNENKFSIFMEISNNGDGAILEPGAISYTGNLSDLQFKPEKINKVDISFDSPGLTISDCKGIQELQLNKKTTLICNILINNPPTSSASYSFQYSVKFIYLIAKSLTAKVSGV